MHDPIAKFNNLTSEKLFRYCDLRDNKYYTDEHRQQVAQYDGWNSWQELMDAGLASADYPELTDHCPTCGQAI